MSTGIRPQRVRAESDEGPDSGSRGESRTTRATREKFSNFAGHAIVSCRETGDTREGRGAGPGAPAGEWRWPHAPVRGSPDCTVTGRRDNGGWVAKLEAY
jgi:hypothetical protein